MTKRIVIASAIFVVYLAIVIGVGYALHLEGSRFAIFCVVLGVVGLLAVVAALIYMNKAIALPAVAEGSAAEASNLDALVRAADAKLKGSKGGAKTLASMPLVYVIGDENSGKTQTVMQSGLDAELLAGQVTRDGMVAPTQLANLWYTSSAVVVEAGGVLLRQPDLWRRLVALTQPNKLGSALKKGALQPTRAAVLCVSIERVMAANSAESVKALAQMLNERLRTLSEVLGISLPVYVLFTKLDTIPSFADYATNLTDDEVRQPVGALLARTEAGAGLYAERATAQSAGRFDELCYSLAEFRIEVLTRGGPADKLARAYEFPRELRKLRSSIVDLLVEVGRPSQLGVNPFLRGFYFSGMRARLVEDNMAPAAMQQPPPMQGGLSGSTQIFSFNAAQAQVPQAPVARSGGTRRVPQWVFLPHLFPRVVLTDRSALETSRASTKVNVVKRLLIASVAACLFLYLVGLTVSYFNNAALESRLRAASAAPTPSVNHGDLASTADLQGLEALRAVFAQIAGYRKDGAPFTYRLGLYGGEPLYKTACAAYGNKFRTVLLTPTQSNILAHMSALPGAPLPTDDYSATYRPMRAYLITTSNPEKSTADFLPAALEEAWAGKQQVPQTATDLSLVQFQTYASTLAEPDSCMAGLGGAPKMAAVGQGRAYLSHFQGLEQVYLSMKAAADRKFHSIRFNDVYPGTVRFVVDPFEVEGAYTKGGYTFMQDAILHPEPYTSGEQWVLGPQTGPSIDRATLAAQLPARYLGDFLAAWRSYLKAAHVVPGATFDEAKDKLHQLDSPSSALLELFLLISQNTAVKDPAYSLPFQAPQSVVPPSSIAPPVGTPYAVALQGLEAAINSMLLIPNSQNDPAAVTPVITAASAAENAVSVIRGGFTPPDTVGAMDTTSEKLLLAPIKSIEEIAKSAPSHAADGGAKSFCGTVAPILAKFPFNPDSNVDATPDEVVKTFQPGQGIFAQYAASLNKLVVLQGNAYVVTPGSTVNVNPAFLHFLNAAQSVSAAFFPTGGSQPQVSFTLLQETTPNLPTATLEIDGTTLSTAGQTKQFLWTSTPGSTIRLNAAGYSNPANGPWSLFHFVNAAKHPGPNRLEFIFQVNGQTATSEKGVPLDYKYDVGGVGAPLLNPGFMRSQMRCVAKVGQ
jgi:type VI secretion system protein ImpL